MGQADGGFSLIHSNDSALPQEQGRVHGRKDVQRGQAWGPEPSSNPLLEEEGNAQ